jgi:hypothetical protein
VTQNVTQTVEVRHSDPNPHIEDMSKAPTIVAIGATPYGGAVAMDMSQEQIDELAAMPGTAAWEQGGTRLKLSILRESELLPLVLFDITDDHHYSALIGVLNRGTIHVCAAGGLTEDGVLTGGKVAFTLNDHDRMIIKTWLAKGPAR